MFALARFLIEYAHGKNGSNIENKIKNNEATVIKYSLVTCDDSTDKVIGHSMIK